MKFKQHRHPVENPLFASIRSARSELDQATLLFNELTDDTGVDYASYNLLAARAKYSYLLKLAKEQELSV